MVNSRLLHDKSEIPGSASNPILIEDDDKIGIQYISEQDGSNGDTVWLSTPEFWENLGDGGQHIPHNTPAVTDLPSVLTPLKFSCNQGFINPKSYHCMRWISSLVTVRGKCGIGIWVKGNLYIDVVIWMCPYVY